MAALAALVCGVTVAEPARASQPLEYPDNGSAAFSRGGAWLATGTDPIAAHYSPATLVTQRTGLSLEQNLAFNKVCYMRLGPPDAQHPSGTPTGSANFTEYQPTCNAKQGFPRVVPALAGTYRVSEELALGFAIVPPSTYAGAVGEWPATARGLNTKTGQEQQIAAPYRYLNMGNASIIMYPTWSVGYALTPRLRVGAGLITGFGLINVSTMSMSNSFAGDRVTGDRAQEDGLSTLKTQDFFIPGIVLNVHASLTDTLDVALWGRWIDDLHGASGQLTSLTQYYSGAAGSDLSPLCQTDPSQCTGRQAIRNVFDDAHHNAVLKSFRLPTPPEVRVGLRYHQPRPSVGNATALGGRGRPEPGSKPAPSTRDPLHDDIFDVEVNASYSFNRSADEIEVVMVHDEKTGQPTVDVLPSGKVPPVSSRRTGYKDSVGVRLGGQYNVIADQLALRAGTWIETEAQDPAYLTVEPVPGLRGGYGGGLVVRTWPFDVSFGYQYHWNRGLDNSGNGKLYAASGSGVTIFDYQHQTDTDAKFHSYQAVNGGNVTQSAHVFTLGGVVRF